MKVEKNTLTALVVMFLIALIAGCSSVQSLKKENVSTVNSADGRSITYGVSGQGNVTSAQSVRTMRAPKSTIESLKRNLGMFESCLIILKSSDRASLRPYLLSKGFRFIESQKQGEIFVEAYSVPDVMSPIIGYSLYFHEENGPLLIVDATVNPLNKEAVNNSVKLIHSSIDSTSAMGGARLYFLGIYDLDVNRILKIMLRKSETSLVPDYAIRYAVQNLSIGDLSRLSDEAELINDYFANAVRVYVLKGESGARVAALAAAKVAASVQRQSMVEYLNGMETDIVRILSDEEAAEKVRKRLLTLKKDIEAKDWTIEDIIEEKQRLSAVNPDYRIALDQADPTIFLKYHPELFER